MLVPIVGAMYLTTGCTGFWDQPVDKGTPKNYLFTTTTTPPPPPDAYPSIPAPSTTSPPPEIAVDYAAVCVDPTADIRAEDSDCEDSAEEVAEYDTITHYDSNGVLLLYWRYYDVRAGIRAAAVGEKVTGGTYTTPRAAVIVRAHSVAPSGGSISNASVNDNIRRGGFGISGTTGSGS